MLWKHLFCSYVHIFIAKKENTNFPTPNTLRSKKKKKCFSTKTTSNHVYILIEKVRLTAAYLFRLRW